MPASTNGSLRSNLSRSASLPRSRREPRQSDSPTTPSAGWITSPPQESSPRVHIGYTYALQKMWTVEFPDSELAAITRRQINDAVARIERRRQECLHDPQHARPSPRCSNTRSRKTSSLGSPRTGLEDHRPDRGQHEAPQDRPPTRDQVDEAESKHWELRGSLTELRCSLHTRVQGCARARARGSIRWLRFSTLPEISERMAR